MISQLTGSLLAKELDRIEILTPGGVAYECLIPLSVFETLPALNATVAVHTYLSVREDAWHLYAFVSRHERAVFQKLLVAKGVGPALALGILSALTADGVVRSIRAKDVLTLMRVPRVGRKKAEQLILDLADKMDALLMDDSAPQKVSRPSSPSEDSIRALLSLGYTPLEAERAVKAVVDTGTAKDVASIVRASLAKIAAG